eukprot:TRINITY_DN3682_c0_g1_i1.p1 TRINITY_DN3682_c0_g1~~TRINITY_DN3682_c0_g1_i1.p1  ORF type:complete len:131 (-),score=29.83 TRINITY_DN3682_c0_g1_i1:86-478(-)
MKVFIEGDSLVVKIEGFNRFLALKSKITVKLEHISRVVPYPEEAKKLFHGIKVGTGIPGVVVMGSFYQSGGCVFIYMHDKTKTVGIELVNEGYTQLVLETPEERSPEEFTKDITQAISSKTQGLITPHKD